jgi:ABC-type sugar transport system ATPase subunit
MHGIHKSFPGVKALEDVDLQLHSGEVLALMGENGAGKSTLIKVLSGGHRVDSGEIVIEGKPVQIHSPHDALRHGIGVIYQEFNLVPSLSVRENIFLGREKSVAGFFDRAYEQQKGSEIFRRLGYGLDLNAPCRSLTVAQQQLVEIVKALSQDVRMMIMDEPSAALTSREIQSLFRIIKELKDQGIGVIYVSHRLEEIFEIADRVQVMRDGRMISNRDMANVTRELLIEDMVGRTIDSEFPRESRQPGPEKLRVEGLSHGEKVQDVSFRVCCGEVLGITGLVGSGRTELARIIFGADRPQRGRIFLDGKPIRTESPRQAIRRGICLLTEDRKSQGLVLKHSVLENFALPNLNAFSRWSFISSEEEQSQFEKHCRNLNIRLATPKQKAGTLSGGNQQKVVLAKWLEADSEVIIFDEPTRGIDVGAKYDIYLLINELARRGKAIVIISSELPEILGMSDRILVMHEGRVTGEITDVEHATQDQIMGLAIQ